MGRLYYGWIVVLLTFCVGLISAGIRATPSVFIVPLEGEFGWNRAAISAVIATNLFLFGLAAPISGKLIDRFGPRWVMIGAFALLALGVGGTLFMNQLWQLQLFWGVAVGLAAGSAGSVMTATVATRWFVARRGLVVGFLGTANSTGQLIFIPLLMAIVVNDGWRAAAGLMAGLAVLAIVPIFIWMRSDPSEVGLEPYGTGQTTATYRAADHAAPVPVSQAIRTPVFWLLAGSFFICGATSVGLVGTHLIPHSIDHGIGEVTAAATVGIMGAMNIVGTMGSGWLTDRADPRRLLTMYYALRGLSLFVLPFVTGFPGLLVFAVIFGLDWFATVPPTVTIAAQRFGRASIGSIYGWIFLAHQLGASFSAVSAGTLRVWMGDYQLAFLSGGLLALTAAALTLLIQAPRPAAVAIPHAAPA